MWVLVDGEATDASGNPHKPAIEIYPFIPPPPPPLFPAAGRRPRTRWVLPSISREFFPVWVAANVVVDLFVSLVYSSCSFFHVPIRKLAFLLNPTPGTFLHP